MPNRIIRDGLLDSERYWSVSIESRQMFVHMLLLADDFGCISVSPTFLRRRCFADGPSTEKIARLLNELQDVDLIRLYDVDRACFAFIPRFRQRLQRSTLKHPKPPFALLENDEHAQKMFQGINDKTEISTVGQPLSNGAATVGQQPKRREEKRSEEKRSTANARPKGSRLSPEWVPPDDLKAWAKQERPDLNLRTVVEEFRDYWIAQPGRQGVKLDWDATFRNWVRRQRVVASAPGNSGPAWWTTEEGTMAKGRELGVDARPGEDMATYRKRIADRIRSAA